MKDLTNSSIDRQNILNNNELLVDIQKYLGITGILYESKYLFTPTQVAEFYGVSVKTIECYVESSRAELKNNGLDGVQNIVFFNFKAFLNIGMLITESEKAKELRSLILDIVIDNLNVKLGGTCLFLESPMWIMKFENCFAEIRKFEESIVSLNNQLEGIKSTSIEDEYDNFLGIKRAVLLERIKESTALLNVFKRLKDR